jgi:hypothetical protein
MPTNPDNPPPHNPGLWMNPRLWTPRENTNIQGTKCQYPVL